MRRQRRITLFVKPTRRLILVFGGQLSFTSSAFDDFDAAKDVVWMAEVSVESTKVASVKTRIAMFISVMRHFREEWREDRHFLCSRSDFAKHAGGRKQLRMEFFYREIRLKTGVLMKNGKPTGGQWSFDHDNRGSFGKAGPGLRVPPRTFKPDGTVPLAAAEGFIRQILGWRECVRAINWHLMPDYIERNASNAQRAPACAIRSSRRWAYRNTLTAVR
ncbi:hypothetical protein BH11VER1_BH11VER1_02290 [soil metagenome]